MQWMRWEARIDHNHVTVCFPCNICSRVSGYHLIKRATMEEGAAFGERRKESEEKEGKKHNNNNNFDNYSQNVSIKSDVAL